MQKYFKEITDNKIIGLAYINFKNDSELQKLIKKCKNILIEITEKEHDKLYRDWNKN